MSTEKVKAYYDEIAWNYDNSRFSNTYGQFIDKQEKSFLEKIEIGAPSLSLGCGTGRLMEYCTTGIDFSEEMLKIARVNFPNKRFECGDARQTPFQTAQFETIICFHVFMHLPKETIRAIFKEINRILKPGGLFIFDYPTKERRKLTQYKANNWHGATAFSKRELHELISTHNWNSIKRQGVLFFPIHLFPKKTRNFFYPIDQALSKSLFKKYSSYIIHAIKKPEN